MQYQIGVAGLAKGREAEKTGVIAMVHQRLGFGQRLGGRAADAANANERNRARPVGAIHFLARQRQNRFKEADSRIADGKLGRVDADGEASGAGGRIVPRQRPLMPLVERAAGIEGERVGRDDQPAAEFSS